jgi:hypothetical protein
MLSARSTTKVRSEGGIDLADAERLAGRLGWQPGMCERECLEDVARSLDTLRQAGFETSPNVMTAYIRAVETIAAAEVSDIPVDDPEEAVRYVVLGTALAEPLLLALRRMAEQITAVRRFPPKDQHGNG